jgi:hypothetical protein
MATLRRSSFTTSQAQLAERSSPTTDLPHPARPFEAGHQARPASNHPGLQRNPLAEEPEAPAGAVARGNREHLLAHPVEGLVIESALVDAATVPVAGATVVAVVTAGRSARTVATPRICTGRSEAEAEQSSGPDSGGQGRCR